MLKVSPRGYINIECSKKPIAKKFLGCRAIPVSKFAKISPLLVSGHFFTLFTLALNHNRQSLMK